jgi:hypothetical protein
VVLNWKNSRCFIYFATTLLRDKVCQQLAASQWFSPGTPVSFTNKTDRHHIAEVVLKVALNTKPKLISGQFYW